MKFFLLTLCLALMAGFSHGHSGVDIGPNGGRLVGFSKDKSLHGEILVNDGKFHLTLLDKDRKPVGVSDQTLTATGGTRKAPEKLTVTKDAKGFSFPIVKEGEWLILQFKSNGKSQAITARMHYDTSNCSECSSPEWLCKCKHEAPKK